jgi:hypothetical protein
MLEARRSFAKRPWDRFSKRGQQGVLWRGGTVSVSLIEYAIPAVSVFLANHSGTVRC